MYAALYKIKPAIFNKVTSFIEQSPYPHIELLYEYDGKTFGMSANLKKGVRIEEIVFKKSNWDFLDISPIVKEPEEVINFFHQRKGSPYDTKNIMRFGVGSIKQNPNKFVCSEICAEALGWSQSWRFGPALFVARLVDELNKANNNKDLSINDKGYVVSKSGLLVPGFAV